jgi:hypothetical protein
LPRDARPKPQRGEPEKPQPNSAPGKAGAPETQRGVTERSTIAWTDRRSKDLQDSYNSSLTEYYQFGKQATISILGIIAQSPRRPWPGHDPSQRKWVAAEAATHRTTARYV